MMNVELLEKARDLARQNFDVEIEQDLLSDDTPIYLVSNPELPGCRSQGGSIGEALSNLDLARIDYLYSLLEDGIEVPLPNSVKSMTGSVAGSFVSYLVEVDMDAGQKQEPYVERVDDFEEVILAYGGAVQQV